MRAEQYQHQFVENIRNQTPVNRPGPAETPEDWYDEAVAEALDAWLANPDNNFNSLQSLFLEGDEGRYATLEASLYQELNNHVVQGAQACWRDAE